MVLMVGRGGRRAGSQAAWSDVLGNADVLEKEDWMVGGFFAGVEAKAKEDGRNLKSLVRTLPWCSTVQ